MHVYIKFVIYSKMALDADTSIIVVSSVMFIILGIIATISFIDKPLSNSWCLIIMAIFLFILILPAFIISTVSTAALIETNVAVSRKCPPHCTAIGRKPSNITTPAVITSLVAFGIGCSLLGLAAAKSKRPDDDAFYRIIVIVASLLFAGISISTIANYLYVNKIQTIMAKGDCSQCAATVI